jgi:hypothetical protein
MKLQLETYSVNETATENSQLIELHPETFPVNETAPRSIFY